MQMTDYFEINWESVLFCLTFTFLCHLMSNVFFIFLTRYYFHKETTDAASVLIIYLYLNSEVTNYTQLGHWKHLNYFFSTWDIVRSNGSKILNYTKIDM